MQLGKLGKQDRYVRQGFSSKLSDASAMSEFIDTGRSQVVTEASINAARSLEEATHVYLITLLSSGGDVEEWVVINPQLRERLASLDWQMSGGWLCHDDQPDDFWFHRDTLIKEKGIGYRINEAEQ